MTATMAAMATQEKKDGAEASEQELVAYLMTINQICDSIPLTGCGSCCSTMP
jgi:hypothetical protein